MLFGRCSIISFFSYLDWLDHASFLKDLVKIVRSESELSYKQIWKERLRSRLSWIYRESDQPRSKLPRIYRKSNQPRPKLPWSYRKSQRPRPRSPLTYSKLGWSSHRLISGKLSYGLSATTTRKKQKKRGWDKSPSLSIVFGLSSKTQWLSGLY